MSDAWIRDVEGLAKESPRALTRLDEFVDLLCRDVVGDRIRAVIRQETPTYSEFSDHIEEQEWAAGIDVALRMFVACVRERRNVTAAEQAVMERIGSQRAEQPHMTLDAIEASIRVATATAFDFVLECGDLRGDEGRWALRELSKRLTAYGNEITAAALRAFLTRKEELAQNRARADARLFDDVLGGATDAGEIRHRAAAHGIDFDSGWGAVLIAAPHSAQAKARKAEAALVSTLPRAVAVPMATAPVPHAVVIYPLPSEADLFEHRHAIAAVAATTSAVMVTVGRCVGIDELRRKYASARSMLPYAPVIAPSAGLLDINDVPELGLLTTTSSDARQAYLDDVLGSLNSLPSAKRPRFQLTLEALALYGKAPKAISHDTGYDIKTTRRYIDTIESLTGLCLDRVDHLRRLGIAVELAKLVGPVPISD